MSKRFRFKLLSGKHSEGRTEDGKLKIYKPGAVFDTDCDLNKMNAPGCNKFELLLDRQSEGSSVPELSDGGEVKDEFSGLTVSELKAFAEENEIDLTGATRKEDILAIVRAAV